MVNPSVLLAALSTGVPILDQILFQRLLTSIIIVVCTIIWIYVNQRPVPVESVAFNYTKIIQHKQLWRMVSASFTHYSLLHLLFNMASLWSYGYLEYGLGQIQYTKYTFLLLVLSFAVQIVFYKIAIDSFRIDYYREMHAIGYSCVVFGWMTLSSLLQPNGTFNMLGFNIPLWVVPFMSLILTQLIIPNASFVGHASGIAGAYMIHMGLFFWFFDVLYFIVLVLFIGLMIFTLKKFPPSSTSDGGSGSSAPSIISQLYQRIRDRVRGPQRTIIDGVLVDRDASERRQQRRQESSELSEVVVENQSLMSSIHVPEREQGAPESSAEPHTQVMLPPMEASSQHVPTIYTQQHDQDRIILDEDEELKLALELSKQQSQSNNTNSQQ